MKKDFEFKQEQESEPLTKMQQAQLKIDKYANFFQKVSHQYLQDPFATMLYFKDCYVNNRLDPRFINPPLNFYEEMGLEPEEKVEFGSNLMERFYTSEKVQASNQQWQDQ